MSSESPQRLLKISQGRRMPNQEKELYEFGPFQLDPNQRLLLRDNQPVPLQPKAFEILLALIQNSDRVVLKEDLMKSVWPDTFVEESNLTQNVFVLRKALGEPAGERRYIITVQGRGYRFAEPVRTLTRPEPAAPAHPRRWRVIAPAAAALLAFAFLFYRYFPRTPRLTDKSTIVLADFTNMTGDPVFDGALRQGLSAQLDQTPYLNLLPDQRITQTLSLMSQPKDAQLTPALAREVCQRTGSAAVLDGSIAQVGARYLLTLEATTCAGAVRLASANAEAGDKNHVLATLGEVAVEMRGKLGESMDSIEKYDAPLEDVTTRSLEALKAYSAGSQEMTAKDDYLDAIPLFQQAVNLDPNFAMAHMRLGINFYDQGQPAQAAESLRKAYQLRERVGEREKLYIEASYAAMATGNMEAARTAYGTWARMYPRDQFAVGNLGVVYQILGDNAKALAVFQDAWKLNPANTLVLSNIVEMYLDLNRLEEAKATVRQAQARHEDTPRMHEVLYEVDFLQHDTAGMKKEAAELMGRPGWDDVILAVESDTAAYAGQFGKARELTRRAAGSAGRAGENETASVYWAASAVREALVGNVSLAKQQAMEALARANNTEVDAMAAIALALAGDFVRPRALASALEKDFPEDTLVQFRSLPSIHAAIALREGDAAKAIQALAPSMPYELGHIAQTVNSSLYTFYLRGEAHLSARQGLAASAEFQKILDYPGIVRNELIGALAHLGLARAYALSGESSKAHAAYQDFLALWKDADADIPVLKQAKGEFATLQSIFAGESIGLVVVRQQRFHFGEQDRIADARSEDESRTLLGLHLRSSREDLFYLIPRRSAIRRAGL